MIITHQQIRYAKGGDVSKVGGTTKTNNVIRRSEQLRSIEEQMLNFAYKLGRSENQRELRRAKR